MSCKKDTQTMAWNMKQEWKKFSFF